MLKHIAKKTFRKDKVNQEIARIKTLTEALDQSSRLLKKSLKPLTRKPRSFIDKRWESWMKDNQDYVKDNSPRDILDEMKKVKVEKGWDIEMPTRFMISNRKRIKRDEKV